MKPLLALAVSFLPLAAFAGPQMAGVAKVVITPTKPTWMAGYASRKKPAETKLHDLYAKAVCLEDDAGRAVILLTTDLIGLPKALADEVCAEVTRGTKLPRERLMLTSSHTHCGPVMRDNLADMYEMTAEQAQAVKDYASWLKPRLATVMVTAYLQRKPAIWQIGEGVSDFAINRRQPTKTGVVIGVSPDSPVDHRVPVLTVTQDNKLAAIVFGYACHNTTLDNDLWSGDYAGFAQIELEKKFPDAVAMFWSGCGADANPNPRRTVAIAERHGKSLAAAVADVIAKPMTALSGTITAKYDTLELDYAELPTKAKLQADAQSTTFAVKTRAKRLLAEWDRDGALSHHYLHFPVQSWHIGDQLTWVALGGEVVVDYALRIRSEFKGRKSVWVTGYANDVMAYIPSDRILHEGGYEADASMIYYGHPTRWAYGIEERIVEAVKKQKP